MKAFKVIVVVAVVALCGGVAFAQKAGLANDAQHGAVGTTPCGSCHTPHGGTNGASLLWVHSVGTTTYTVYTSPTITGAKSNFTAPGDGGIIPGLPSNNTLLCLSCHDGALAAAQTPAVTLKTLTYGTGAITGTKVDIGGGAKTLTDDHPVNITHDPALDPGLAPVVGGKVDVLPLYTGGATTNTVQCGTCHDPHKQGPDGGAGAGYYLRKSNTDSGLCLTCHL